MISRGVHPFSPCRTSCATERLTPARVAYLQHLMKDCESLDDMTVVAFKTHITFPESIGLSAIDLVIVHRAISPDQYPTTYQSIHELVSQYIELGHYTGELPYGMDRHTYNTAESAHCKSVTLSEVCGLIRDVIESDASQDDRYRKCCFKHPFGRTLQLVDFKYDGNRYYESFSYVYRCSNTDTSPQDVSADLYGCYREHAEAFGQTAPDKTAPYMTFDVDTCKEKGVYRLRIIRNIPQKEDEENVKKED